MDHQAKVILTALNGDLSIAERTLTLTAKDNAVPVGRASKSVTKGILGAVDNAWFDSPVMSRNHATIEFNPEDMTVTIQDIGSMHGTHLNNFELPRDTPTVITDGDVVVFGAEVRRGPETFPACSFRVNHKIVSYK
ncbi:SMAD/FHA domain-containing protein [Cadophora sp. DSE1049]|nr:SMAD/FHA domain-containing protein [Cadophora sp. DSE1049]